MDSILSIIVILSRQLISYSGSDSHLNLGLRIQSKYSLFVIERKLKKIYFSGLSLVINGRIFREQPLAFDEIDENFHRVLLFTLRHCVFSDDRHEFSVRFAKYTLMSCKAVSDRI